VTVITGPWDTSQADDPDLFTSSDITSRAGITYRQLDFWARVGYLQPGRQWRGRHRGSGSNRVWPRSELAVAQVMKRLTTAGLPARTAHRVARSGEARTEIAPGVWIEVT
jgi:DNA-binding transcriptional MerR regulator